MTNKLDLYTRIVLYNNEIILNYTVTMQILVFAWQTNMARSCPVTIESVKLQVKNYTVHQ